MGITGVLSYLEYALLHKMFVMGVFRRRLRSEQAMAEVSDLGPVSITLNDYRVTFDNGQWVSDYPEEQGNQHEQGNQDKEVLHLRHEKKKLQREVDKLKKQTREMDDLKERWSNLDFKYQLLMDMWTLRALDNEKPPSRAPSPHARATSPTSVATSK